MNTLYLWITKGFTFNMNASHDWTIFKRRQLYLWIMFRLEHDAKLASGHMDALADLLVDLNLRKILSFKSVSQKLNFFRIFSESIISNGNP